MQLLNRQIAIVNFEPLRAHFMAVHTGTQASLPGLNAMPSLRSCLQRNASEKNPEKVKKKKNERSTNYSAKQPSRTSKVWESQKKGEREGELSKTMCPPACSPSGNIFLSGCRLDDTRHSWKGGAKDTLWGNRTLSSTRCIVHTY